MFARSAKIMKTTILRWRIVSVIIFAATCAIAQRAGDGVVFPAAGEPQIIHLNDHTKLTLLGASYGSHHLAPHFETLVTANWFYTATNATVVWIEEEHEPGKQPTYELLVSDRANAGCVNIERRQGSFVKAGVSLQSFVLSAFPRWDKETILRVKPYMGSPSKEQFILTNPVPGMMAQWTPEPLPATKSDGDLEVTLTKLTAGAPVPYREGASRAPTNDPANQCVHLDFDFRQNGQPTTNWQAGPVQTTDAVGNWSRGLIRRYPKNGINPSHPDRIHPSFPSKSDGYYFQPGLWPDQPWKVQMEFIQRFNFSDDEMVTFTNLPVIHGSQQDSDNQWTAWNPGKTNFPFFITPATVSGVHLKLLPPLLVPNKNSPGQEYVSVIIGADPGFNPRGMNLTVVEATDDQGHELRHPFGSAWAGHYNLEFPHVHQIKSLNLKLALHKSRFVEFTVQPARP
jgi:hypothetical protein